MKKSLFLIFILLSSCFQFAFCATDEGYGEDQSALGQFTDTFVNDNNVSVAVNVINNQTLDCMELNVSGIGGKLYENFNTYTQVEPDNRVDVINDTHIAHNAQRDEDSYAYYNYGPDYFGNFTHTFIAESDFTENYGMGDVWMISDTIDDEKGIYDGGDVSLNLRFYRVDGSYRLILVEIENGNAFSDWNSGYLVNTKYYFNVSKHGTNFTARIYTDLEMTVLKDKLSLILQSDYKLEYIYACNTWNSGTTPQMNTDIYNLWLGKYSLGYATNGYFTTEDYLNDTNCNGSSLALMVNTSIPGNTDIQVQFSNDNATWGDWEGIPLDSNILIGGFESIDLRYLNYTDIYFMFNFSTTDSSVTPRLYQARLISTIGVGGAGPGGSGAIGYIMLILICSPIIVLIVWRKRR